jgi:hypothetical protein
LIGKESDEWREELYRRALINNLTSYELLDYDTELLAEWRKLYDTLNNNWAVTNYWSPDVLYNPYVLDYWLDFIYTDNLADYSVDAIGKRSMIVNKTEITSLYAKNPVEEIYFLDTKDIDEIPLY